MNKVYDFSGLNPNEDWAFTEIGRAETNGFTHGYHRYPAKFIPQIAKKLMEEYTPVGARVCDIFGGCGTTLVEAKLNGRYSVGFDINPIATMIAKTKVTALNPSSVENAVKQFEILTKTITVAPVNHHPRLLHWFEPEILAELDQIYASIQQIRSPEIRRFFLVAFSHNLKSSSKWLMKSIKPTIDQDKIIEPPQKTLRRHLTHMVNKNELFFKELNRTGYTNIEAKVFKRDSTKTLPLCPDYVDLIISSPPYVTSYEYADLHQLSLLWFSDDTTHFKNWARQTRDFDKFRETFVGTNRKRKYHDKFDSSTANNIVTRLAENDKPTADVVSNYFLDMKKSFSEMRRILKPNAKACLIIGNTNLSGVEIINAEVAAEQLDSTGFEIVNTIKRTISNKMITPWRDSKTGKFTNLSNANKKPVYQTEYIIVAKKN